MPHPVSVYRDLGRLNAFTDGVMVVSMTLLVLDVRLPDAAGPLDEAALWRTLSGLWPKYLGYVVSFLVIAQYWMGYTEKFGRMRAADNGFAWLNIFFLLLIGFIPFVTTLVSVSDTALATSLYAGIMVGISLMLIAMWFYALRRNLVEPESIALGGWREVAPWMQIAAVFGASIAVAQWHPQYAKLCWFLLAVPLAQWVSAKPAG